MQQIGPAPRPSAAIVYAARALIELSRAEGQRLTSAQIEQHQDVPSKFLDHILARLRRAGLVASLRGPHGGYVLCRPSQTISLADIVTAIEGQFWTRSPVTCPIDEAWGMAATAMLGVISGITLDMLDRRQRELAAA